MDNNYTIGSNRRQRNRDSNDITDLSIIKDMIYYHTNLTTMTINDMYNRNNQFFNSILSYFYGRLDHQRVNNETIDRAIRSNNRFYTNNNDRGDRQRNRDRDRNRNRDRYE